MPSFPAKLPLDFAFTTQRLLLRRLRESDVGDLTRAADKMRQELANWTPAYALLYLPEAAHAYVAEGILQTLQGDAYRFGAFDKTTGEFLAHITLRRNSGPLAHCWNIGYWCAKSAQNKGYVTEALHAVTNLLFTQLGAQRAVVQCATENTASNKTATKCGFVLEGTASNGFSTMAGTLQDLTTYAHTPESWRKFTDAQT